VKALIYDGRLEQFRNNARRVNNRAVYEIPDILNQIMRESDGTTIHELPEPYIIPPELRSSEAGYLGSPGLSPNARAR
jgi:hypothetical protein